MRCVLIFCIGLIGNVFAQSDSIVVSVVNKITLEPLSGFTITYKGIPDSSVEYASAVFKVEKYNEAQKLRVNKPGYNTGFCSCYHPSITSDSTTIFLLPVPDANNPAFEQSWQTRIDQLKQQLGMSDDNEDACSTGRIGYVEFPEVEATFLGGPQMLQMYVRDNIIYPEEALEGE